MGAWFSYEPDDKLTLPRHYYYRLKGEYSVHSTPKNWFRRGLEEGGMRGSYRSLNPSRYQPKATISTPGKKTKKSVILSQTMVIDIDPHKVSYASVLVSES
jgi:hypothetical protein